MSSRSRARCTRGDLTINISQPRLPNSLCEATALNNVTVQSMWFKHRAQWFRRRSLLSMRTVRSSYSPQEHVYKKPMKHAGSKVESPAWKPCATPLPNFLRVFSMIRLHHAPPNLATPTLPHSQLIPWAAVPDEASPRMRSDPFCHTTVTDYSRFSGQTERRSLATRQSSPCVHTHPTTII